MSKIGCPLAFWPVIMSVATGVTVASDARAQGGHVTFWNRFEGGTAFVASEVGPDLYPWDPRDDGSAGTNDVGGPPRFVPGRFGYAVTMGPGDYYSMARVHGLVLRGVSSVVNPERGTIAVWYRERQRPVPFQHNLYKLKER